MTIFLSKELTRNLKIGNASACGARDTKFGTNFSNEMLLNAEFCQGYSFYEEKTNKEWVKSPLSRLGL